MQDLRTPIPAVSQQFHGFEVVSRQELPEFRAVGVRLRHQVTKLDLYHVICDDPENVFAFAFLTPPPDSTGVAHILEHTVLCGSRNYPLKDPFLVLMKGSMSTFLNALTFPDKTVYPAASANKKDLFNIMRVYGDAVFFPLLSKEMFSQEGHRLEFDGEGRLRRTGIVLNEMKGNYSNHDSVAAEWSLRSVLPDTTYGFDSGGDPREIPRLTYDEFVEFHRSYYHPSNCRVFLYGDTPTEEYCRLIQDEFLRRFDGAEGLKSVPSQGRWSVPRRLTKTAPIAAEESTNGQTSITLNWLLGEVTDPLHTLTAEVVTEILVGHSGTPLYQAVSESDLGDDLSSPTGLETDVKELVFSAGIRGTEANRCGDVESLILGVLSELVREGIDPEVVEGALRKTEFRNREIRGGGPYGLRLLRRALRGWMHGGTPDQALVFRDSFGALEERIAAHPRYFEAFIEHYLIDNPHRTTVTVVPDAEQEQRERVEEETALRSLGEALQDEEREGIRRAQETLTTVQQTDDPPEIVDKIPFLTRKDLPRQVETIASSIESMNGGGELLLHDLFTNGVVYLDMAVDLTDLPAELLVWLPMFSGFLTEIGVSGLSYSDLHRKLAIHTGGLSTSLSSDADPNGGSKSGRYLILRMRLLAGSLDPATDLLRRIVFEPSLDNSARLHDLLKEAVNDARSSIVPGGTSYAALRTAAALSPAAFVDETWKGITQLEHIAALSRDNAPAGRLQEAMGQLHRLFLQKERWSFGITAEEADIPAAKSALSTISEGLVAAARRDSKTTDGPGMVPLTRPRLDGYEIPAAVNFTALSLPGFGYATTEYAIQRILGHVLRTGRLWEVIRMRGGAYGAFAMTRGFEGLFSMASYRDPNVAATLGAFAEALESASTEELDDRSLELAVVATVGRDSRPMSPGEKGYTSLRRRLVGVTDAMRQRQRDRLLDLGPRDVTAVARQLAQRIDAGYATILGGSEAIDAAATELPDLTKNRRRLRV